MWSHYAASHSGVCFQFHVPSGADVFGFALPVEYANEYVRFNWLERDKVGARLGDAILRKAPIWDYEHERRILEFGLAKTNLTFKPRALKGVILGARATKSMELELVTHCRERALRRMPPLRLYRAVTRNDRFALEIRRASDLEKDVRCAV